MCDSGCMLLHRCSLCRPMWQEGWCTKPVLHLVTQAPSALQVLWRVHLCTTSIWTSLGRHLPLSTKLCLELPQVRKLAAIITTTTAFKCLASLIFYLFIFLVYFKLVVLLLNDMYLIISRSKHGQCVYVSGSRHQWTGCSSSWSGSSQY